jgi:hypothetical protein
MIAYRVDNIPIYRVRRWDIVSRDELEQLFYEILRESGESHHIAEICALRRSPGLVTDSRFNYGHVNGNEWVGQEDFGARYKKTAKRAGVDITGARYLAGLARYPGDPEAWVRSRADVKDVAKRRGYTLEGSVNYKGKEVGPPKPEPLIAPDIMKREMMREIAGGTKPADAKDKVLETRLPSWKKKDA